MLVTFHDDTDEHDDDAANDQKVQRNVTDIDNTSTAQGGGGSFQT